MLTSDLARSSLTDRAAGRLHRPTCLPIGNGHPIWLFAGSKAGGERAAAIYSVIETAKLNGVEPQTYIADVIEKVVSGWPASRWDEFIPWNWTAQSAPVSMAA